MSRQIASKADYSILDEYKSELNRYRERNYTYSSIPEDGHYYHIGDEELCKILSNQYVKPATPMLTAFSNLKSTTFL